ncbi:YybH family protein [Shimwellia blattae]|uniref:YybH family protein n=1 Tax=Shimwellia blattae TaxID=563 RepID=UPI000F6B7F95|nr:nuclear transport factor 2 family protein [Shimwellia blattae]VDY65490.1 SnoaL-like domain [Shimwellia blattae]
MKPSLRLVIPLLAGCVVQAQAAPPEVHATTPESFSEVFTRTINSGNIDALLGLYHDDAVVVTDGVTWRGKAKIKENLQGFMQLGGKLTTEDVYVLQYNDTALVRVKWRINDRKDSARILAQGESTEVLQKTAARPLGLYY